MRDVDVYVYVVYDEPAVSKPYPSSPLIPSSADPPIRRREHERRTATTRAHEDSRMPISFHFSQSAPMPTRAPGWPLMSLGSRSSYSLPKARKCAKRELKWPSERRWRICG
ncbi:hypothetical protein GSI_15447 [Ganoderma sinense ZZ0214-1]|uniref:Uncharacterized protein n=1 Tax=Ganoderma sinense ZZ0214-1 TaxID=1077348 RepID=A0A2G8RML3_9APHY|nr:hypothetical protein GSI_15447 [Ganoderma sinense ZZ0214-1]